MPSKLINKLRTLGLNTSLCNWILDFLTGHPQVVRVSNNTSATLILNTGAPQGCVLSPLLYSLFTHDCTARHDSKKVHNWFELNNYDLQYVGSVFTGFTACPPYLASQHDVYRPWIADAMYWPMRGFEDTGRPYWHSPEEAVLRTIT